MAEEGPLEPLICELSKLPGIGRKSAQRLAFHFMSLPVKQVETFSSVLTDIRSRLKYCRTCFNICFEVTCSICQDDTRDERTLCVVSNPQDILALERTQEYRGLYHVLGGLLSPIDGVHPEMLRIRELTSRIQSSEVSELILAINSTIEGEATILYLTSLFEGRSLRITKLASGLPLGSDIDYADELTLQRAFSGRTVL